MILLINSLPQEAYQLLSHHTQTNASECLTVKHNVNPQPQQQKHFRTSTSTMSSLPKYVVTL